MPRSQKRLMPSISMLTAFEATARHGSLSGAAQALNRTQGAISRQVAALENQLGIKLIARVGRGIELTDIGGMYAAEIREVLEMLRNASLNAISGPLSRSLNLGILPTFGTRWLMPRFPAFLAKHPDITVNFATRLEQFDFRRESIDAAIHFGTPDWPGAECTFLMGEKAVPVCSPQLTDTSRQVRPDDIAALPLLHLESRANAWHDWFAAQEIDVTINSPGMLCQQFSLVIQAAVAGVGVALLPRFLIHGELERGELVALLDTPFTTRMAYYLVTPTNRIDYPPVVALREWLLALICAEADQAAEP
ncbi:MAG: LysR family transcriptional regulator [Woeseia sp.]